MEEMNFSTTQGAGVPVVMTIAGSDNSAGAGLQADLRTVTAMGGYALTAVTCVVAEVPGKVEAIAAMVPGMVEAQVRLGFEAFPVGAVKTGMLFSAEIVRVVAEALRVPVGGGVPLVVDPVMVASSGDPLLEDAAVEAYRDLLFPLATLVTPNLGELAILAGREIRDFDEVEAAGRELALRYHTAFLLKGGHLKGDVARDVLLTADGGRAVFEAEFVPGVDPHGTGCTYSAAISVGLASGRGLEEAVRAAKGVITRAIRERYRWGETEILGVERAGKEN